MVDHKDALEWARDVIDPKKLSNSPGGHAIAAALLDYTARVAELEAELARMDKAPQWLIELLARADVEINANAHKGDFSAWYPSADELVSEVAHHFKKWCNAAVTGDTTLAREFVADLFNYVRKANEQTEKEIAREALGE